LLIPLVALAVLVGRGDLRIAYGAGAKADPDQTTGEQAQESEDARLETTKESDEQASDEQAKEKNAKERTAKNRKPTGKRGDKKMNEPAEDEGKEVDGKVVRSEREWRRRLTREEFRILRQKGTERPYDNKYDHHFEPGSYACAGCGQILFDSDTKFDSGCGWPAFYAAEAGDRVQLTPDYSFGVVRTEVTCSKCDGHLGHIFDDAPQTPTGQRYCINSVSLKFISAEEMKKRAEAEKKAAVEKAEAEKKASAEEKPKGEKKGDE
jgi:peptide-methionine (R)-S-oxide reductase